MRRLEIAVVASLFPFVFYLLPGTWGSRASFGLLAFFVGPLIVWQVGAEGYRWQMLPAYALAIFGAVYECMRWDFGFRASYFVGVIALLFEIAAVALCTALPVFKLPAPSGRYKVGTQSRHIIDSRRRDPFSDRPDGVRELMIQIWYPVDPSVQGSVAPYRDKRTTTLKSAHFSLVESHSMPGARVSLLQEQYPVLLYTPSWSGIRTECTFQVEELASHGYVVVGIDHPYCSGIVVFPDGRIARRKFRGDEDYSSEAAVAAFVETADQQVEIRSQDACFVLDTLEDLNANDPLGLLKGRLDLARVGIFGFSLGGGTAAESCWLDRRFKAGLDMGGMIAGGAAKEGTGAPFFFMFEGLYGNRPYAPKADVARLSASKRRDVEFTRMQFGKMKRSLSEYGGYWMMVHGIKHRDFCDSPFFSPLRRSSSAAERVARIISRYAVAFFDQHLRGVEQPVLDEASVGTQGVSLRVWKTKAFRAPSK
jgi:hypothetical protein